MYRKLSRYACAAHEQRYETLQQPQPSRTGPYLDLTARCCGEPKSCICEAKRIWLSRWKASVEGTEPRVQSSVSHMQGVRCCTPVILGLERWRHDNQKCKLINSYPVSYKPAWAIRKGEDGVSSGSSLVQVTHGLRVHGFKGHAQRTELSTHSIHPFLPLLDSCCFFCGVC